MSPAIRLERVGKRFGRVDALGDVSFEVAAGSAFGLAGVNGAGKTTLIKCILDLASASTGRIEIFGLPSELPAARSRLAFLPERFMPPHYLDGRGFLAMMAGLRRRRFDEAAVLDILAMLDLDPTALSRPTRAYSKGMTQKLGLAACFLAKPDLIILDEPMSGLDPRARASVKHALARFRGEGRTLFMTSHALADIDETCDVMAVLDGGRLRYCGSPARLRDGAGAANLEEAFLKLIAAPVTIGP